MDQPDSNLAISTGYLKSSKTEQQVLCMKMEKRLNSRCLGLIEVDAALSDTFIGNTRRQVRFMHQSVVDFVHTREAQVYMNENLHDSSFPLYTILMGANILIMKHLSTDFFLVREPTTYLAEAWYRDCVAIIRTFMTYATTMGAAQKHEALKPLVDAMDDVATQLFDELLQLKPHRDRSGIGSHWSGKSQTANKIPSAASIISFAVEYGLCHYVESYFKSGGKVTRKQAEYALQMEQDVSAKAQQDDTSLEVLKHRVRGELKNATRSNLKFWDFQSSSKKRHCDVFIFRDIARNEDQNEHPAGRRHGRFHDSREWHLLSQTAFPDIGNNTSRTKRPADIR